MKKVYWLDIVTLKVIHEYSYAEGHPPSRARLWSSTKNSLINDWLRVKRVHPLFCEVVKSNGAPSKSIKNLRQVGFLPSGMRTRYFVTGDGQSFLSKLPSDYRQWPIVAYLDNNRNIDFHKSVYALDGILSVRITHEHG